MKLILGSSSISRKSVLENAGYEFTTLSPDIDEKSIRYEDPKELVMAIAQAKANALENKVSEGVLVCADQVLVCNGTVREKPESDEQAREWFKDYGEHPIELFNAMVMVDVQTGKRAARVDRTLIIMKPVPEDVMDAMIEEGEHRRCAGGLMAENPLLEPYVVRMEAEGDPVEGLKGLSMVAFNALRRELAN